jgi:hypothetical protein
MHIVVVDRPHRGVGMTVRWQIRQKIKFMINLQTRTIISFIYYFPLIKSIFYDQVKEQIENYQERKRDGLTRSTKFIYLDLKKAANTIQLAHYK